jgi:hypothetical protein
MHAELPAVNLAEFPDMLYVRIEDEPGLADETTYEACADHRELANVYEKTVIGVYRLDRVATLTVTTTLEPQ